MEIGIGGFPQEAFTSTHRLLEVCEEVEGFGFDRLWMADSQGIWPDPYALLGRLAEMTTGIGLGVGVSNPRTRHPAVLARASVTLTHLAGERFVLGIGAGNTAFLHLGFPPAGVELCGEAVGCIRSLIRGEDGTFGGARVPAFHNYEPVNVPVYLAANGPKMLSLAGEIADGAIVSSGISPEILNWVQAQIDQGLKRSGRGRGDFRLIAFVGCAVSEDRQRARGEILSWVARRLSMPLPEEVSGIPKADRLRALEAYSYTEHYRVRVSHGGVVDSIPDEWVDRFGIAGAPQESAERLASLSSLGVDAVFILPITEDSHAFLKTFSERLLPRLRR
ncbi:MAG: LLM class flavin-dependent oxidoreductase [Nitrospinota bacterium]